MRRLLTMAVALAGLVVSTTFVVQGALSPARASSTSLSCDQVTGHWLNAPSTLFITFSDCSGPEAVHGTATYDSITWHRPTGTTTFTDDGYQMPGPNACGAHDFIDVVYGPVTGGTSTYTQPGDTISFTLCGSPYGNNNKLHQLPNSSIRL
jgi:hypothetical protein